MNAQSCLNDTIPPEVTIVSGISIQCLVPNESSTIWANDFVIEAMDNCSEVDLSDARIRLSGSDILDEPPTSTYLEIDCESFLPDENLLTAEIWVSDEAGNWSFKYVWVLLSPIESSLTSFFYSDWNQNCQKEPDEPLLNIGQIPLLFNLLEDGSIIDAVSYQRAPSINGQYTISVIDIREREGVIEFGGELVVVDPEKNYSVEVVPQLGFFDNCNASYIVPIENWEGYQLELPIQLEETCPSLTVDVSTPFLRRCFSNRVYIRYNNLGVLAEQTNITLTIDEFLKLETSSIPFTKINETTFLFDLGEVASFENGLFWIETSVSCESTLGQTHCIEVDIFAANECVENTVFPKIDVNGACRGNEVQFKIKNVGKEDMLREEQYIVIEDVIMLKSGKYQLNAGGEEVINLPASDKNYRLEAYIKKNEEEQLSAVSFVEGCTRSDGVENDPINIFPIETEDLSNSIECLPNIGSFDPNDKHAFPSGVGEDNFIRPNIPIKYKIRFQNTGTDTAFNVVIKDTISQDLDLVTFRVGVSSHPFTYRIDGQLVEFRFNDILLPDSATNEPASHGFITFYLDQVKDLPDGSLIENRAGIYFDFNEPIITNYASHQVQRNFIVAPQATITGTVTTFTGRPMPNVTVQLDDLDRFTTTNVAGEYTFTEVPTLEDYKISLEKNDQPLNGVDILDMIQLSKQILAIELFTHPLQNFAGDVNRNNANTTFDLVFIRRLIEGNITELNEFDSWRFFDVALLNEAFNSSSTEVPSWREGIETDTILHNQVFDFLGVKDGDINDDSVLDEMPPKQVNVPLELEIEHDSITGEATVSFIIEQPIELAGYQLSLQLVDQVELIDLILPELNRLSTLYYFNNEGSLNVIWLDEAPFVGYSITDKTTLFSIKLRGPQPNLPVEDWVKLRAQNIRTSIMVDASENVYSPYLKKNLPQNQAESMIQLIPNPTNDRILLKSDLQTPENVFVEVVDNTGRVVFSKRMKLDERNWSEWIPSNQFKPGLYYVKIRTSKGIMVETLVKTN